MADLKRTIEIEILYKQLGLDKKGGTRINDLKKLAISTGTPLNKLEQRFQGINRGTLKWDLAVNRLKYSTRQFKMELLGVMFFGLNVQKFFTGLLKPSMDLLGVFDLWNTLLSIAFLPAGMMLLEWVINLWGWFNNLSPSIQNLINIFVLLGAGAGGLIYTFGMLALGINSLTQLFSGLTAAKIAWLGYAALIIAAVGSLIWLWKDWENIGWQVKVGLGFIAAAVTMIGIALGLTPLAWIGAIFLGILGIMAVMKNWGQIIEWIELKWAEFKHFMGFISDEEMSNMRDNYERALNQLADMAEKKGKEIGTKTAKGFNKGFAFGVTGSWGPQTATQNTPLGAGGLDTGAMDLQMQKMQYGSALSADEFSNLKTKMEEVVSQSLKNVNAATDYKIIQEKYNQVISDTALKYGDTIEGSIAMRLATQAFTDFLGTEAVSKLNTFGLKLDETTSKALKLSSSLGGGNLADNIIGNAKWLDPATGKMLNYSDTTPAKDVMQDGKIVHIPRQPKDFILPPSGGMIQPDKGDTIIGMKSGGAIGDIIANAVTSAVGSLFGRLDIRITAPSGYEATARISGGRT